MGLDGREMVGDKAISSHACLLNTPLSARKLTTLSGYVDTPADNRDRLLIREYYNPLGGDGSERYQPFKEKIDKANSRFLVAASPKARGIYY